MVSVMYDPQGNILACTGDFFDEDTSAMMCTIPINKKIVKIDTSVAPNEPIFEDADVPSDVLTELKKEIEELKEASSTTSDNVSEVYDALCDIDERVYTLEESNNAVEDEEEAEVEE